VNHWAASALHVLSISGQVPLIPGDSRQALAREAIPVLVEAVHIVPAAAAGLIGRLRLELRTEILQL
jgi:hypothetical protein